MDLDQTAPDLSPDCLPVCKNRFEKFARIFSRHHKQTTFSDAGFLGVLRVNIFQNFLSVALLKSSKFAIVCHDSMQSLLS